MTEEREHPRESIAGVEYAIGDDVYPTWAVPPSQPHPGWGVLKVVLCCATALVCTVVGIGDVREILNDHDMNRTVYQAPTITAIGNPSGLDFGPGGNVAAALKGLKPGECRPAGVGSICLGVEPPRPVSPTPARCYSDDVAGHSIEIQCFDAPAPPKRTKP